MKIIINLFFYNIEYMKLLMRSIFTIPNIRQMITQLKI